MTNPHEHANPGPDERPHDHTVSDQTVPDVPDTAVPLTVVGSQALFDDIFRERILRARQQTGSSKLMQGIELFESACRRMRDGLRWQYPELPESEITKLLHQRLDRVRQIEDRNLFFPMKANDE